MPLSNFNKACCVSLVIMTWRNLHIESAGLDASHEPLPKIIFEPLEFLHVPNSFCEFGVGTVLERQLAPVHGLIFFEPLSHHR
jgi:hypothetical protein